MGEPANYSLTYTLTIQYNVFGTNTITRSERMPSSIDVGIQVLLGGLAGAHSIARIIVAKYITIDALT